MQPNEQYMALRDLLETAPAYEVLSMLDVRVCAVCGKRHRKGSRAAVAHNFGKQTHQLTELQLNKQMAISLRRYFNP